MSGLIGEKIGMISGFDAEGRSFPCTVIDVGGCVVVQIKTLERDGYEAVQLGFKEKKEKHTSKPEQGHFKKSNLVPRRYLVEFKNQGDGYKLGDVISVDFFDNVDYVDITGVSKGKGFQGVVKRHNFRGVGQSTLGQSDRQRHPGSIGASSYPAKVFKGMRMAGQMGNKKVTVKNLEVIKIILDHNLLLVKGSVPGAKGSIVIVKK